MKRLAYFAMLASLAGCASTSSTSVAPTPAYFETSKTVMAPTFPISRLAAPEGMDLVHQGEVESQAMPASQGGGIVAERSFAWNGGSGEHLVMTALYRSASGGTYFVPNGDVDGVHMAGDKEVAHLTDTGRFADVVYLPAAIPMGSPRCAIATAVIVSNDGRQREVAGEFAKGIPCDQVSDLAEEDFNTHRQRAFQAFGLL